MLKLKRLFVVAVVGCGVLASADYPSEGLYRALERDSAALSQRLEVLRAQDPRTVDSRTLDQAMGHLRTALQLVNSQIIGQNPGYPGNPPPPFPPVERRELVCVSRDDDGRQPYVMAIRNPDLSLVKLSQQFSGSSQDCQDQISHVLRVGRSSSLMCASRDGDGRFPYALYALEGSQLKKLVSVSNNLNECYDVLQSSKRDGYAVRTCVSRDDDGRNPFVMAQYSDNGQFIKGQEAFQTLQQCRQSF